MSVGVTLDWLVCFPCWNPQSPWKKRKLLVYACTSKGKMAFSLIFVYTTCSSRCRTCPSQGLRYRRQAVSWGYLDQSQLARAQSQWQLGQMWPPRWCLTSQSPENTMLETSPNVPKFLLQGDFKEVLKIVPKKKQTFLLTFISMKTVTANENVHDCFHPQKIVTWRPKLLSFLYFFKCPKYVF